MKLRHYFTAIASIPIICASLLSGCTNSENDTYGLSGGSGTPSLKADNLSIELYETDLSEIEYKAQNPVMFCADGAGNVVCIEREANALQKYSASGEPVSTFPLPESFTVYALACDENKVYVLGKYDEKSGVVIGEISDSFTVICETEFSPCSHSGLVISDGKLYFSAVGAERSNIKYNEGYYSYDGTVIYSLDPKNGSPEPINAENPVCFSSSAKGIMIYGCDSNGFYFADYNGELGDKQYSALAEINAFCLIGENVIVYSSEEAVKAALLSGNVSSVLIDEKAYGTQPFALSSGSLIYNSADEEGNTVLKRIRPQEHIKNLRSIDIIMSLNDYSILGSTGYALGTSVISENELSLKLLSGDTDWDAAVIYSRQTAASDIAEQGVFLPLGDIAGDYLEECPDGVRKVCTNDGNIWAIPIETNINVLLYNKERCAEIGIDFAAMAAEDFLLKSRELCENSSLRGTQVDLYWDGGVTETLMNDCINSFGIDSPEFREIARLLHDHANTELNPEYMHPAVSEVLPDGSTLGVENNAQLGDYDNFLYYTAISYGGAEYTLSICPELSVSPIPSKGNTTGYSMLLMVNPNSDNLEETLKYVKALSEEKLTELMEDRADSLEGKKQLMEIYDNADIIMGVPYELYMEDYTRYLRDEITLDEFIKEADRKLTAYLNE